MEEGASTAAVASPRELVKAQEATASGQLRELWRRYRRNRTSVVGLVLLLIVVLAALLANYLAPYDPYASFPSDALLPPSGKYWLGTDDIGRDIFSRIVYGARVSLFVGLVSMTIAAIFGVTLGMVSGFYGRLADGIIMRLMDSLQAFPAILLAIFILAVLGPSLQSTILAIGVIYIPAFARITRANVLSIKQKEYVEAARALGARDLRIMMKSILPNVYSPLIVQASLGFAYAVLVEAALSFLGLGVQPPEPSWGSMLGAGRGLISMAPWFATFPGIAIFLTVLALNFIGDGLREALDPHMSQIGW
ncbi:MAG: ABC transporter permease [Chloroflexota bacterium]